MIIKAIQSLMIKKNHNLCIYVHNLSEFDGVYLFTLLSSIKDATIKPIFKDGKFINIDFILGKIKIKFRDSLLMLPLSLKIIGESFGVNNKDLFPLFFPNFVPLEYSGKVPSYKYFNNINKSEYKEYCKVFKNKK
jgi:hypothetical protein